MNLLSNQYNIVKQARHVLFEYIATISPEHFVTKIPTFGNRDIRTLLIHVGHAYQSWLGKFAMKNPSPYYNADFISDINDLKEMYGQVDVLVNEFILKFHDLWDSPIFGALPNYQGNIKTNPLCLYTHVITHEFHHKGQILSMTRLLGYTPIDTDVIRFS